MIYEDKRIEKALNEMGFEEFTEIQSKTIPVIKDGFDCIGHSQTGTGKTAAFTLPILDKIDFDSKHVQALILCPTRELAVQVTAEIDKIGKYIPKLKTTTVFGGQPISKQIYKLKNKPQIIVGTPGRTIDHINRKLIRLNNVKFIVLDEADEMMKMGFKEDIETILGSANDDHQTIMFSATMPKPIIIISKTYMNDPKVISVVSGEETNKDITQYYYNVQDKNKVEAVARLLHVYNAKLTLIFCNTKRKVDDVTRELTKKGYNVDKIHGDLQQTMRLDVLNKFHNGVLDVLVATDVAARGLDIKNVEAVINFDVPEKAEFYVHRIGRTGRIGNKGYSFTLVSRRETGRLQEILKFTKSTIKKRNIPTPEKVLEVRETQKVEEITEVIENINTNPFYNVATKLLIENEPIDVVEALLYKLEKEDNSEVIKGDINEDYTPKNKSQSSKKTVRFHLNMGTRHGVNAKKLAEFVTAKTRLRNKQIMDIAIRNDYSFFTAEASKKDQIMRALSNVKFSGKTVNIQVAKDKDSKPQRKRRNKKSSGK
jgi:ATP-dependent RNA helicase DeaD